MKLSFLSHESFSPLLLLAAALLVGVAISFDGPMSRGINGVAGMGWFLAAIMLTRSHLNQSGGGKVLRISSVVGLLLVLAVKPTDLVWAAVGFTIGGAIVGMIASGKRVHAALV